MQLVQTWIREENISHLKVFTSQTTNTYLQQINATVLLRQDCISSFLLEIYKQLLSVSAHDLKGMSKSCPMHGFLTALRFCLEHDLPHVNQEFLCQLVDTLHRFSFLSTLKH